jgi:hypothetical protein
VATARDSTPQLAAFDRIDAVVNNAVRMLGLCSLVSTAGSIVARLQAITSSPRSRCCSWRAS